METRSSIILGVASLLVTITFSISNCQLQNKKQVHEIRTKYLELVLTQKSQSYENERILRFLKRLDDDKKISEWAADELDTIARLRQAKDSFTDLAQALASPNLGGGEKKQVLEDLKKVRTRISKLEQTANVLPSTPQCLKGTIRSKDEGLDELCIASEGMVNLKLHESGKITWSSGLYFIGLNNDKPVQCECIAAK